MPAPNDLLHDDRLREVYQYSGGSIAFIDESFFQGEYYTMTGVMFARENLAAHRRRFLTIGNITGMAHWHTSEAYRDGYFGHIRRMVEAIGQRSEWAITTVRTPLAGGSRRTMELARADCLESLLREFSRGPHGARVFVLDRLDERGMTADTRLASRLMRDGELPPQTRLRHSTAELEPMLDAPDTISWATRQLLARNDPTWIAKAQDQVSVIHLDTGEHLNVPELVQNHNSARAAAAEHPAPDLERRPRGSVPYSSLLPLSVSHQQGEDSTQKTPMEQLVEKARAAAGESPLQQATERLRDLRQPPGPAEGRSREPVVDLDGVGEVADPAPPQRQPQYETEPERGTGREI